MQQDSVQQGDTDPNFMLSLARGLEVLRAFEEEASLTVTQAAHRSGLNRSSAGRCLHTLMRLGYLVESDGQYALSPRMLPLAGAFLTSNPLASAIQAAANGLRDHIGETVSAGVLDPMQPDLLIYMARAEKNQVIAAPLMIGSTLPSYCTSMGRVLLAEMDDDALDVFLEHNEFTARTPKTLTDPMELRSAIEDVRRQGWALVQEELEPGLRSIAVPVRNRSGMVVAALNIATFSHEHSREYIVDTLLPDLRGAAAQLARVA